MFEEIRKRGLEEYPSGVEAEKKNRVKEKPFFLWNLREQNLPTVRGILQYGGHFLIYGTTS